jgi:FeS assembly SUF system protein
MKPLPVVPEPPRTQPGQDQGGAETPGRAETSGMVHDAATAAEISPRIIVALKTVFDPEIPVDIYELGLVYDIIVEASGAVGIRMTLTAPACPAAQFLPSEVRNKVAQVAGVTDVKVDVVWDPPWDRERMSEAAKLQLGMF